MKQLRNALIKLLFELSSIKNSKLLLAAVTLAFTTASTAAWRDSSNDAPEYVDSINKWGAWELDIEPAAGGLPQPSAQVLNARESKVSLRTNSVSALSPSIPHVSASASVPVPPKRPVVPPRVGPVGPTTFAPPAATPGTKIVINLPPTSNITPITKPRAVPSGTSGLF